MKLILDGAAGAGAALGQGGCQRRRHPTPVPGPPLTTALEGRAGQGVAAACRVSYCPGPGLDWTLGSLKGPEAEEYGCGFRKVALAVEWGGD